MGRSALIGFFVLFAACKSQDPYARPQGGAVCDNGNSACGANMRCVNRNCTATCPGQSACASGNYCGGAAAPDDVCQPDTPRSCLFSTDCPDPQDCFWGLCASTEFESDGGYYPCTPTATPGAAPDDCPSDSVCIRYGPTLPDGGEVPGALECTSLPACGKGDTCPPGDLGNLCNADGKMPDGGRPFPGKARMCLRGLCMRDSDCNSALHCFHGSLMPGYGDCQAGSSGDPCFTAADCPGAKACAGADGGLYDGGTPGSCQ